MRGGSADGPTASSSGRLATSTVRVVPAAKDTAQMRLVSVTEQEMVRSNRADIPFDDGNAEGPKSILEDALDGRQPRGVAVGAWRRHER